jgi:transcriptional pleiotropic regulator of transition state genes
MKATGIVRRVDELGRVVIPIELRRTYKIDIGDPLEIYVDSDKILLKKFVPTCMFCGAANDTLITFREKVICKSCVQEMPKQD